MKTGTIDIDQDLLAEAKELREKQKEVGTTLVARAFAYEMSQKTPADQKSAEKHRKAIKIIYNMDGEKAVVVADKYLRSERFTAVTITAVITMITSILSPILLNSVSIGYKVGFILFTGITSVIALVATFECILERIKIDAYTVKLAKGWLKAKAVFNKYDLLIAVGEDILPAKKDQWRANFSETELKLVMGDMPELTKRLFSQISYRVEDKILELALRNKKAQAQANREGEIHARKQMSELIDATEKVIQIDSAALVSKAFEKAEQMMREEILGPTPGGK